MNAADTRSGTASGTASDDRTWLVAVDDDPTGCQSVSGVPLLTSWDDATLRAAAQRRAAVTFVLTNSRSMCELDAVRVNAEVGEALSKAADSEGLRLRLISRSDSTLRGHFPAEVDALARGAAITPDGVVICPAFFEAGRFTAEGIQWVHRDGQLVPARDTEFASDATFGFSELTLADWARARGASGDVIDIGLSELSCDDDSDLVAKLSAVQGGQLIVVNATNYIHLRTFDSAARRAEATGATFVYRTGPSYCRAAARLDAPTIAALSSCGRHGLIVVGSHTDLTNAQVARALDKQNIELVELNAHDVLDERSAREHAAHVATRAVEALAHRSVLLRTSREVISGEVISGEVIGGDNDQTPLEISRSIAQALTDTVRTIALQRELGWVIAKGGITAHELLTAAFGIRTAEVIGQALPGIIPVLEIDVADRRLPYVIFPGNVGDEHTLTRVLDRLVGP